jgi:4-hydroxy-tetrahydrodipicolinate synthase
MEQAGYPCDRCVIIARQFHSERTVSFDGPAGNTLTHTARDRTAFARARRGSKLGARQNGWAPERRLGIGGVSPRSHIYRVGTASSRRSRRPEADEAAVHRLARRQIDAGIHFLCPCGTTGENPTLTDDERSERRIIADEAGAVPVLLAPAATTRKVVHLASIMQKAGASGLLGDAVPQQADAGRACQHYKAIAESTPLPIVVYNACPHGVNVRRRRSSASRHREHHRRQGSERQRDADMRIVKAVPREFLVLSGDDVDAAADGDWRPRNHRWPRTKSRRRWCGWWKPRAGDFASARETHLGILPLMLGNFIEASPVPVKAAMAAIGRSTNTTGCRCARRNPSRATS